MNRCGIALLCLFAPSVGSAQDQTAIAKSAKTVLETHCYGCHGRDGKAENGVFVLNRDKLVAGRKIVPGKSAESSLLRLMEREKMPPEEDIEGKAISKRPSKEEVAAVRAWIDAGAPEFAAAPLKRDFITDTAVFDFILADLKAADERTDKFYRYLTITHLYNAGRSDEQLQSYRAGISKLVNSLSWKGKIKPPTPIDPAKTILRIDLRDYNWSPKTWEAVFRLHPYGVAYPRMPAARLCCELTQCPQPFVRGDWFVFAAAKPPLYHIVLDLPEQLAELEKRLVIDRAENIRNDQVARAGFNSSGVSKNNRLIERHSSELSRGAYWISYDFAGNTGRQNLFEHPLDFKQDGGEIIFNLPNGLQAYMLVDGAGRRLDQGPLKIVSDPDQPDRTVTNGISCMRCHAEGMRFKADQVRDAVDRNPAAYSKAELNAIRAVYPEKKTFESLLNEDARRFKAAVEQTGAHLSKTEPIFVLSREFDGELNLATAAAEVGTTPDDFLVGIARSQRLGRVFGTLKAPGGAVGRDAFVEAFAELIKEIHPDASGFQSNGGTSFPETTTTATAPSVLIKPPALTDKQTIKRLPDVYKDVVAGGGGRYLIFHLPKPRKLAVFDINEARVTGYIPLADDNAVFAAGLEKVVIGLPGEEKIERWNLATMERETSVDTKLEMKAMCMGHASHGPVLVSGTFLDLESFKPILKKIGMKGRTVAAADGTVFAEWYADHGAGGRCEMWVVEGDDVKSYRGGELGHLCPGPNGKTIFTSHGLFNGQLEQIPDESKADYCLPAMHWSLYVTLTSAAQTRDKNDRGSVAGKGGGGFIVRLLGQSTPILKIADAGHGLVLNLRDPEVHSNTWGPSKRVYFIPQANVIVTLPPSNDRLVLHKLDLEDALEKSGVDYLFVASPAPPTVQPGGSFRYPLVVRAKQKEVACTLDSGPAGMQVTKEGVITWTAPADAPLGNQEVLLTIKDGKGQEIFHSFRLRVANEARGTKPK
jgi:mono/diheme cytochrome c family protein